MQETINFYTIHCPQCKVIEKKLNQANISYNTIEGVDEIKKLGYLAAPILQVGDKCMTFKDACIWIKEQEKLNNHAN